MKKDKQTIRVLKQSAKVAEYCRKTLIVTLIMIVYYYLYQLLI